MIESGPLRHWIFTTACCPPEQLCRPPASRKPLREHPHSCSGRSIVQEPRARHASPPRAGGSPPGEVRQPRGELRLCSARPQPARGAPAAAHSCRRSAQPHMGAPPPASPAQPRMGPPLSARRALAAALPGRHPPIRTWDRHRPCGELVQACVGSAGGGKAPERIRQQGQYCHFTSLSQLK